MFQDYTTCTCTYNFHCRHAFSLAAILLFLLFSFSCGAAGAAVVVAIDIIVVASFHVFPSFSLCTMFTVCQWYIALTIYTRANSYTEPARVMHGTNSGLCSLSVSIFGCFVPNEAYTHKHTVVPQIFAFQTQSYIHIRSVVTNLCMLPLVSPSFPFAPPLRTIAMFSCTRTTFFWYGCFSA